MNGLPAIRRLGPVAAAVALLVLALGMLACSPAVPTDSGIRGTVRIGPTSPVQRQGEPADGPFAAELVIRDPSGAVIARARSGADGAYSVNLAPGDYTIEGVGGGTPPTPPSAQSFTVRAHAFTVVDLAYDSGIR